MRGKEPRALGLDQSEAERLTDVGIVECRGSLRFTLETLQRLMILGEGFRQELERHEAVELRVLSLVDDTHAAATKSFDDSIM
jgi:hypothetical protein